ncbi:unnamed protein product [Linum trigynum]
MGKVRRRESGKGSVVVGEEWRCSSRVVALLAAVEVAVAGVGSAFEGVNVAVWPRWQELPTAVHRVASDPNRLVLQALSVLAPRRHPRRGRGLCIQLRRLLI